MTDLIFTKVLAKDLTESALKEFIEKKASFQVIDVDEISLGVNRIEREIERQQMTCRVYTEYRTAAIAGIAVPTGFTQLFGIATAIGVGIHNAVTYNPDYEIGKNKLGSHISVFYKK
ncbi:hypothetical protein [Pantoea sp. Ep11b]|uniref:hypothetical protein n=1 Tax=Pantoea sp. Ep11b TaxID=3141459 RepID=UPI00345F8477